MKHTDDDNDSILRLREFYSVDDSLFRSDLWRGTDTQRGHHERWLLHFAFLFTGQLDTY